MLSSTDCRQLKAQMKGLYCVLKYWPGPAVSTDLYSYHVLIVRTEVCPQLC